MFVVPFLVGHLDGEDRSGTVVRTIAEEIELAHRLRLLGTQHRIDGIGVHQKKALARMPQRVETACLDQRLGDLLIAGRDIDLVQIVREVSELPLGGAGGDQRTDDVGADIADGTEAEPDIGSHRGEVQLGLVDIRRQDGDPQLAAVGQIHRRLVLVVAHRCQQPGHVLARIIGFEIRRPIRHQPVSGGVRFVERVVGERKDCVPQHFYGTGRESVGLHTVGEALVLLVENIALLLAHGFT